MTRTGMPKKKKSTTVARVTRRKKRMSGKRLSGKQTSADKTFELSFEYSGGHRPDLDKLLRRLAKRLGGKESGSGFSFMDGQRDIQFLFPDKASRCEFLGVFRSLLDYAQLRAQVIADLVWTEHAWKGWRRDEREM
jgi:hypothetical protein